MRSFFRTTLIGVATWAVSSLAPTTASACGGFFCNTAQPVNQAAEGIVFADNGDGTVTAVIQIQYQGPSKKFSWLLPISSVPKTDADVGIASNLAIQRLQAATNPTYTLNVRVEGTCRDQTLNVGGPSAAAGGSAAGIAIPGVDMSGGGGVTVEASGIVGAFDWTVISLDKSLADPADVAVQWLKDNGYDVPSSAPKLLGPYLESGLYLLAVKLTKGADAGSIRPIVLTYAGTQASIPIKLTAVAANDDMGVLTWVLGKSRAVPQNYLSLELNEARINWFNANSNYNSVVTDAANDAGGQGFVTEFAGSTSTLKNAIWQPYEEQIWTQFQNTLFQSFSDFFTQAYGRFSQYDGFWDATHSAVTLPADLSFDDFKLCPNCYAAQITFSPSDYLAALDKNVIQPMKRVQELVDAHPEISRMYTTMSADEMTLDPQFIFNKDLADVSNIHTAERVIECDPSVFQSEAPWRVELPQGGVVRGTAAQTGVWPPDLDSLPPNRTIVRTGASGTGKVVEDKTMEISALLDRRNSAVPATTGSGGGAGIAGGSGFMDGPGASSASGGCNVAHGRSPFAAFLAAAALGAVALRRRRRA